MIIRKKILFLKSCFIILFLFISCENPVENGAEVELPLQKPVITGLVITGEDSPEPLGYWRSPYKSKSIRYNQTYETGGIDIPLPQNLEFDYPYPNPSTGNFVIRFSLPLSTQVSLWVVKGRLPEDNESSTISSSGGTFISSNENKIVIYINKENLLPGMYSYTVNDQNNGNDLPSGFYRVYFKADGHLLFRDIFIARTCGEVHVDLKKYFYFCRGEK